MAGLLAQAQQMQEKLLAAQEEIAATEVTGSAGNGLVTVTGTGTGEVTAVTIDPKVVDPDDVETLQDLLLGALALLTVAGLVPERVAAAEASSSSGLTSPSTLTLSR